MLRKVNCRNGQRFFCFTILEGQISCCIFINLTVNPCSWLSHNMNCCSSFATTNTFNRYSDRLAFLNFIGCFFQLKHTLTSIVECIDTFSCNSFASFVDEFDGMFTWSQVICFINHLATFTSCIIGLYVCNLLIINVNRHFTVVWIHCRYDISLSSIETVSHACIFLVSPHGCTTDAFRFVIPGCICFVSCCI